MLTDNDTGYSISLWDNEQQADAAGAITAAEHADGSDTLDVLEEAAPFFAALGGTSTVPIPVWSELQSGSVTDLGIDSGGRMLNARPLGQNGVRKSHDDP